MVPLALRDCIIDKVHASHLGIQGCLRRARDALFWPGMSKQIAKFISKCSICNSYKPDQQKEPLVCYEIPSRPWQSISADLFELHGFDYLVTTDRYSNFFEVDVLTSKTSKGVIDKLSPIWLDTGFQTELPQTMDHSLTAESSSSLLSSTSLNKLGPRRGTPSPTVRQRTVLKQQSKS